MGRFFIFLPLSFCENGMMSEDSTVHPTAVIHPATRIPDSVSMGPYAVIEDGVELGERCVVGAHAILRSGTILGRQVEVDSHAVVGGLPQDLHFKATMPSGVRVGDGTRLREGVTINRATREGAFTEIGRNCLLMGNAHIGHDCRVGDEVIFANGAVLSGWVQIGDAAFISGNAAVHQKCRIGSIAMVGGLARISSDVPPFTLVAERNRMYGLNLVGLKRREWDKEAISAVKRAWHLVYDYPGSPRRYAEAALADRIIDHPRGIDFLKFFTAGERGFAQTEKGVEA